MRGEACAFRRLGPEDIPAIRELFISVFTKEPWNDDWSDQRQLEQYLHDLTGQADSLTFGLYQGDTLIGVSMGRIKHWYTGTEYCIDELCVALPCQGKGAGRQLLEGIERACKEMGLTHLFLLTEDHVPAYGFYQKLGFRPCTHTVAMAKEL